MVKLKFKEKVSQNFYKFKNFSNFYKFDLFKVSTAQLNHLTNSTRIKVYRQSPLFSLVTKKLF